MARAASPFQSGLEETYKLTNGLTSFSVFAPENQSFPNDGFIPPFFIPSPINFV